MPFTVTIDRRVLDKSIKALEKRITDVNTQEVPRAAAKALNDESGVIKTKLIKELRGSSGMLRAKDLRGRIRINKAIPPKRLRASFWIGLKPFFAYQLLVKNRGGNVIRQARTKVRGKDTRFSGIKVGRARFSDAFLATMPSGHVGIFRRKSSARLPIEEVKIEIEDAVAKIDRVFKSHQSSIVRRYEHELRFRLKRLGLS